MTAPKEMFLPGSTNEWTSVVRPPNGYKLEAAIGTTYCLDFTALTAVLSALLDQAGPGVVAHGDVEESPMQAESSNRNDRVQLLQAITRLEDRVRVLVNRGQIHADVRSSNKLFALFDRMVSEVRHENGNFHPKVWILKYSARRPFDTEEDAKEKSSKLDSDAIYRLICTSRNLTLASTWEAVVCLEGVVAKDADNASVMIGRNVSAFLECALGASEPAPKLLNALVKDLRRVAFSTAGSKAVQSGEFLWQWPGSGGLQKRLESGGVTALMVSPFVTGSFLKLLVKNFKRVFLVSRQEELDALSEADRNLVPAGNLWVVKASDSDEALESVPSLALHAKILLCEYRYPNGSKGRTEAWIGSANATGSAWGVTLAGQRMNCEAMVRFRPAIRAEQFLDQFAYRKQGDSDSEKEPILNGWIERYQPRPLEEATPDEEADELLEQLRVKIGALALRARFTGSPDCLLMTLESTDHGAWEALLAQHQEIVFELCPMGLSEERPFRSLKDLIGQGLLFEGLTMAQASALVLFQLTHSATGRLKQFVVKAVTEMDADFWEQRRIAFLKANLDARAFRAFLRSIVFGGELIRESVHDLEPANAGVRDPLNRPAPLFDDFTIEDVLQSCTEDSSRIDEIDRLVKTFELTEHIDASFRDFWVNFREAIRLIDEQHRR
jgi:hypothetical protein